MTPPGRAGKERVAGLIAQWTGARREPASIRTFTDTTNFTRIDTGDVLLLGGRAYLLRGTEREGRFGIDDEPKYWVRRAIDLDSGEAKVVKMDFRESFRIRIGATVFACVRSPAKEARVIDLVREHPNFMQGLSERDEAGNVVRVIDRIRGRSVSDLVGEIDADYETYYRRHLPDLLETFLEMTRAIAFLHGHGEKHGDIRRDHLFIDSESGRGRWIDFDYNYHQPLNPYGFDLFGLGNVLIFLVGRGEIRTRDLGRDVPLPAEPIRQEDLDIVFGHRVANLKKVYPCISEGLNEICLRFSRGSELFYDDTADFVRDIEAVSL